ncbi:glycoside hydrolase family 2 protein [Rhodococcus fascians]|nr:glycoside hydrolase family 2 protein [Rhodococcus fascians]MBY4140520.1 glycoside hydrolase family 2 protein [Rhodococcus fascians]MBY4219012.1 glycoside hydrolase family 2 protein [Rhodococcus fascians]MBY4221964.1 glycoside hydrolase family 2 protein [Rhodococcus fascians]MBY4233965.1 glycoside hydrolase family 2 protein [Rhodococcus fascians]
MATSSFNKNWSVRQKVSPFAQLGGESASSKPVTLPHDAIFDLQRSVDASSAGRTAYYPSGAFEYTKSFDVPDDYRHKRVSLEFQGVYRDAVVYVNGTFAAQWPYGYSTFVVALDPYLRYGQANEIRVDARTHDDSRWYTGGGIYRDTRLIVTDFVHIATGEVRITTPDVDPERAVVEVETRVVNESPHTVTTVVRTNVQGPDGVVAAADNAPVTVRAGTTVVCRQRIYIREPDLWSVESPAMYSVDSSLGGTLDGVDHERTFFGIRTLQLDPYRGLRINGEEVKLRGACIHHDNGLLGAATIRRADERRIELLKAAGFNAVRSAHNPISQVMLDACDRLGMLVMDETFDVWTQGKSSFDYSLSFPEWWERDIESMVTKNFNHPSVIFYSIGNENFEVGDPLGSEWGRRVAEKVRSLDSTRFVTNGVNGFVAVIDDVLAGMRARGVEAVGADSGVNGVMASAADMMNEVSASELVTQRTAESFSILDVAGLNYGDARFELDRELFPNRVMLGSETFPPRIAGYWRLVEENPHVIGDFTWTGWDYLGEVGAGRTQFLDEPITFEAAFPWITAWVGDLDITGHRRPISYYRETVFGLRHEPYIAVIRPQNVGRPVAASNWAWSDSLSSWNWNVPVGTPTRVEVYSDAEEVELRVNGVSVGRKPAGRSEKYLSEFDVTYEPGEVVALAYEGGLETARTVLSTASSELVLVASADRSRIEANDADLSYVGIEFRDENGIVDTSTERLVSVTVDGAGSLCALGSGRPDNAERYDARQHTTFEGRLLAIVRPTTVGEITVSISSEGFEPITLMLEAFDIHTGSVPESK